ncbi:ABC transporter ATP-binding protein [Luteibacter aegosomatissinici]|uniref:ABC transporter ATP-binding protein n=1 Tax=Luteibacter aegosomatissinici TaxID=2911539 RepID=UPI001FF6FD49|nr:ABC transporter ATP-binding protein [Luteibacter aegosomatissinici]UPG96557.1 ABC transporter ATP-binding protein [Luteibacter aegosomatissinici]
MTQLVDVSIRLAQEGLRPPEMPFLSRDPGFIRALLFQPQGAIVATDRSVSVLDRDLLRMQMSGFLGRAVALGSDLVACPEYSCPWTALFDAIGSGTVPAEGKLWAIACESISAPDLRARLEALEGRVRVVINWPAPGANGEFLDCLCYLFVTRTQADGPPIMLIDDPVAHIDDLNSLALLDYLADIAETGARQIFFATADDRLANLFAKKMGFLGATNFREIDLTPGIDEEEGHPLH